MKPYGHERRDLLTCAYGCCTSKSGKARNCRDKVDRQNRKSARQSSRQFISSLFKEELTVTE